MQRTIKIHPSDNVLVALDNLQIGETFEGILLKEAIPRGHKFALVDIAVDENIIKYGQPIGHAKCDISSGTWVHTHNVATNLSGTLEYAYEPVDIPEVQPLSGSFMGFERANGKVGVRNEIWIVNTVGCVNTTANRLAQLANSRVRGSVTGVYAFPHPYGCSQMGDDHTNTQKLLASMVHHPNAGGVLVLGLGCENNYVAAFKNVLGEIDTNRVKFLVTQESEDELEEGSKLLDELIGYASTDERTPCPLSKLIIGLKCGGSDGFSGITANPLLGVVSDGLCAAGGSAILTEVPEMFGAETILMNRCKDRATFDKTVNMINGYKEYFIRHDQVVYENPSPGNKEGGITTLEDKSLGCTQKGGNGPVVDVLDYAQEISVPGLNLSYGPGNDLCAVTALMASGVQLILFTTGRGTPFGAPVPTLKIATNSKIANFKRNWIDFDAGRLLTGTTMEDLATELFDLIIDVASGEKLSCSEVNGYREIAIFKTGVTV